MKIHGHQARYMIKISYISMYYSINQVVNQNRHFLHFFSSKFECVLVVLPSKFFLQAVQKNKDSLMHQASAMRGVLRRVDHIESYVRNVTLYFGKTLFSRLEHVTSSSHESNFYRCVKAPFVEKKKKEGKKMKQPCVLFSF